MSFISSVAMAAFAILPSQQLKSSSKPATKKPQIEIYRIICPNGFLKQPEFEKCAWNRNPTYLFQTEREAVEFVERMQAERRVNMFLTNRKTVSGKPVEESVRDLLSFWMPQTRSCNGNIIFQPENPVRDDLIWVGSKFDVLPVISPDQKSVDVTVKGQFVQTGGPVDFAPIAITAGFPLLIPKPKFAKVTFENRAKVPMGRTLLIRPNEITFEPRPLALTKVPYLKRLFNNVYGPQSQQVLFLITPRQE